MGAGDVQVGQWGGTVGKAWKFRPDNIDKIIKIVIRYKDGECVNSLTFTYIDDSGRTKDSETFGSESGKTATINICGCGDEVLKLISGTWGNVNNSCAITSLTFKTNKTTYGPYGGQKGTPFSVPLASGKIVGFCGKAGEQINSIGLYVK